MSSSPFSGQAQPARGMIGEMADRGQGMGALYDEIGVRYSGTRRTDPRLAQRIWAALGDARRVLNVGAGTGSYEPGDRDIVAVEPSAVMRAQRPPGAGPTPTCRSPSVQAPRSGPGSVPNSSSEP